MKFKLGLLLCLLLAAPLHAQLQKPLKDAFLETDLDARTKLILNLGGTGWRPVTTGSNGVLTWPNNFITANGLMTSSAVDTAIEDALVQAMSTSRNVYVSGTYGNNGTAERGNPLKPYATLSAAVTAAQSGDVIQVMEGVYTGTNLGKDGVNWYFADGAILSKTGTTSQVAFDLNTGSFFVDGNLRVEWEGPGTVFSATTSSTRKWDLAISSVVFTGTNSAAALVSYSGVNLMTDLRMQCREFSDETPTTMLISGAGSTAANGVYILSGTNNDRPWYGKVGTTFSATRNALSYDSGAPDWKIYGDSSEVLYVGTDDGTGGLDEAWMPSSYDADAGSAPGPIVRKNITKIITTSATCQMRKLTLLFENTSGGEFLFGGEAALVGSTDESTFDGTVMIYASGILNSSIHAENVYFNQRLLVQADEFLRGRIGYRNNDSFGGGTTIRCSAPEIDITLSKFQGSLSEGLGPDIGFGGRYVNVRYDGFNKSVTTTRITGWEQANLESGQYDGAISVGSVQSIYIATPFMGTSGRIRLMGYSSYIDLQRVRSLSASNTEPLFFWSADASGSRVGLGDTNAGMIIRLGESDPGLGGLGVFDLYGTFRMLTEMGLTSYLQDYFSVEGTGTIRLNVY